MLALCSMLSGTYLLCSKLYQHNWWVPRSYTTDPSSLVMILPLYVVITDQERKNLSRNKIPLFMVNMILSTFHSYSIHKLQLFLSACNLLSYNITLWGMQLDSNLLLCMTEPVVWLETCCLLNPGRRGRIGYRFLIKSADIGYAHTLPQVLALVQQIVENN